ncbi:hypothetical protein UY416_00025 [Paenibacillus polymyxa]|uniref:hypothetical protein n=1 Tax=Paenibacillus TaxID=44249 RepID=UPI00077C5749|nr:hypothetical protein [Paenibacillus polymyxa]KYG94937.1 hypothetical protein AZE31_14080 [Paenibacillus polymyxa]MDY8044677.1 hypothetical protein [Paenibacillus polymyxa]
MKKIVSALAICVLALSLSSSVFASGSTLTFDNYQAKNALGTTSIQDLYKITKGGYLRLGDYSLVIVSNNGVLVNESKSIIKGMNYGTADVKVFNSSGIFIKTIQVNVM